MTRRIRDLIEAHITEHGRIGKAQLCEAVGKSERTLDRWIDSGVPDAHDAFKLALACGVEKDEALRLAREEALPAVSETS